MTYDVLVVGAGPAGRALAGAAAGRGLRTALVDPAPRQPWRITYGAFSAELPLDLPAAAVAARARGRAVAVTHRDLGWEYTVLDVPGLRAHLDAALTAVTVVEGRTGHRAPDGVVLTDGRRIAARVVVDAGGTANRCSRGRSPPARPRSRRRTASSCTRPPPPRSSGPATPCSWTGRPRRVT